MSLVLSPANSIWSQAGLHNDQPIEANVNFPVGSTAGCSKGVACMRVDDSSAVLAVTKHIHTKAGEMPDARYKTMGVKK